ncbi:unnamed protein product [Staurois parvus]|uniref:Uncharacterized protein n=1 Tax=Staurois parvus TaxID=386267 RepID=A0ABN9HW21_9NEOB|nr:unnamed protein product [Staurois parvus]
MTRDCGHTTGDDQRLRTVQEMTKRLRTTVQGMTRDCGHGAGNDQRLWTVQGMTRDCRQYRG